MRRIEFDRYQSIQEPAVELNLKFPTIEKPRNAATIDQDRKMPFLDQLRNRMKLIEKRQKTDREDEVAVFKKDQGEQSQQGSPVRRGVSPAGRGASPAKMREELYGLLPSFRSPGQLSDHKKKHKLHKNFKLKIQIAQDASIREVVSEYLEKNIVTKSIPVHVPSQKKLSTSREKAGNSRGKIIFNKEILDASALQNKEELELIQHLKQDEALL